MEAGRQRDGGRARGKGEGGRERVGWLAMYGV